MEGGRISFEIAGIVALQANVLTMNVLSAQLHFLGILFTGAKWLANPSTEQPNSLACYRIDVTQAA
jgi:hypothetical protein